MVEISDFVTVGPVQPAVIDAYRGRVPDDLVELWETYGYGSFAGGFLRVIDPSVYEAEVGDCIGKTQGDGIAIPVMVTGLGDLITWEPSVPGFVGVMYRRGEVDAFGSTLRTLARLIRTDALLPRMKAEIFAKAVEAHGELPYDESFVFVPLLSLGGKATTSNLHKRNTIAAIQMMVEFQGTIGH